MSNLKIKQRTQMSVWSVFGSPSSGDGMLGAYRNGMYLMPISAGHGDAAIKFQEDCSETDGIQYKASKLEEIRYHGYVWLEQEVK